MVKKSKEFNLGAWSFLIGIVIATTLGVFSSQIIGATNNIVLWILVILGIIIGLINIKNKESSKFLFAGLALVIVSYMGQNILSIIPVLNKILMSLLVMFIPATIIVALRSVFDMAKD